jgi:aldehyde dehydrogenase (NAD+)
MAHKLDNYIAGHSVPPHSGQYLDNFSPATGDKVGVVAASDARDIDDAVNAAWAVFEPWRDRKPIERGRIMTDIARAIRSHLERLSQMEALETGKPMWMARFEIEVAAQYFEFYGGLVNAIHGETINLGAGYHSYTRREPFGVVGAILPWNAPINQTARAAAPALAAGNVVVAKPSEETSSTTVELARICVEECGLPAGVFNVVLGVGRTAGAALVEHPKVRKVAFTGSVRAGREVGRIAAERIIPLTLELGGKSPNIVFDDADMAIAVPGSARAFTVNAGQICLAGTRCLVQETVYDGFVKALAKVVAEVKVGPEEDAFVGPITTRAQYEKVQSYYDLAREEGATAVVGGGVLAAERAQGGWFVNPTVYTGVTNDMRIAREEIFGPVASVIPFKDEEDAIRIANDTEYGLAAGIWTQNLGRALRVAARLEAGQIYVNEYQSGGVETPLGGYKQSGYGREKGLEALHHYTQLKCVTIKL